MVARLNAWSQLPAETHPEVPRAATLATIVAPDGLQALKLGYQAQWATLKTRLDEVNARGLDDGLVAPAGAAFVREKCASASTSTVASRASTRRRSPRPTPSTSPSSCASPSSASPSTWCRCSPRSTPTRPPRRRPRAGRSVQLLEARDAALAARKPGAAEGDTEPTPDAEPKGDAKTNETDAKTTRRRREERHGAGREAVEARPSPALARRRPPEFAPSPPPRLCERQRAAMMTA